MHTTKNTRAGRGGGGGGAAGAGGETSEISNPQTSADVAPTRAGTRNAPGRSLDLDALCDHYRRRDEQAARQTALGYEGLSVISVNPSCSVQPSRRPFAGLDAGKLDLPYVQGAIDRADIGLRPHRHNENQYRLHFEIPLS